MSLRLEIFVKTIFAQTNFNIIKSLKIVLYMNVSFKCVCVLLLDLVTVQDVCSM